MTYSVHSVAEDLKKRIPGIGEVKMHKLLYYAQGHHLAAFGQPLFYESIRAWDMGPVVGQLWGQQHHGVQVAQPAEDLNEGALNTIGSVVSRYGGLTAQDLIRLTHNEPPWLEANAGRRPGTSVPISLETMRAYFAAPESTSDDEQAAPPVDSDDLKAMLEGAEERLDVERQPDSMGELLARREALLG